MTSELPEGWCAVPIVDVAEFNPGVDRSELKDHTEVPFVPMPAVEAETGAVDVSERRPFGKVKSGFTVFATGDVLFAKITPCMENGKMAIVPPLPGGIGFGTTEFHVLRPTEAIDAAYLYYFVSSASVRHEAQHNMMGAVGQKRVPKRYLETKAISLPPRAEQSRIVEKIETLFARLDKGEEAVREVQRLLARYRQSILKAAVTGELTADWRAEREDQLEHGRDLLARILKTREQTWQGRGRYKPPVALPHREATLPNGWIWTSLDEILRSSLSNGRSVPDDPSGFPVLRLTALQSGHIRLSERKLGAWRAEEAAPYLIERGDILISRGNGSISLVGSGGLVVDDPDPVAFPDTMIRIPVALDYIDPTWFIYIWNSFAMRRQIEAAAKTTAGIHKINQNDLRGFRVAVPPIEEQREAASLIEEEFARADAVGGACQTELRRSASLRQSILKDAFSGRLVPQDPNDEPASVLLDRIRAERAAAPKTTRRKARA